MDPPGNNDGPPQPFLALPYASVVSLSKLLHISPSEIGELLNAKWFPPESLKNSNSMDGAANHVEAENGQIEAITANENASRSSDPHLTGSFTPSTGGEYQNVDSSDELFGIDFDKFVNEFFNFGCCQTEGANTDEIQIENQQDGRIVPPNTLDSPLDATCLNTTDSTPNNLGTPSEDANNSEEPAQRVNELREEAPQDDDSKGCCCKNSKCIKLYCSCFAKGNLCGGYRSCDQCINAVDFVGLVEKPRKKMRALEASCKRSFCKNKYCSCVQIDVGCSDKCRCENCKNPRGPRYGHSEIPEIFMPKDASAEINSQECQTHSSITLCIQTSREKGTPDCEHPVSYNPMPISASETSQQLFNGGIDGLNVPTYLNEYMPPDSQHLQADHGNIHVLRPYSQLELHGCRGYNAIVNVKDATGKRPRLS